MNVNTPEDLAEAEAAQCEWASWGILGGAGCRFWHGGCKACIIGGTAMSEDLSHLTRGEHLSGDAPEEPGAIRRTTSRGDRLGEDCRMTEQPAERRGAD